ncbi:hypothetical protein EXS71_00285 [Candidatus Uhrbacteria bacterium]|nr:hypothetical protein [Candidatus Uhrbacteria bacterium]
MKRSYFFASGICLLIVLGGAWFVRASIRDLVYQTSQPVLPPPIAYQATSTDAFMRVPTSTGRGEPMRSPSDRGQAIKPGQTHGSAPTTTKKFPSQVNLAIPFLLQAPTHKWIQPYEDACEEASAIMVDAYYRGRTEKYGEQEGDKVILDLIAYENGLFGKYESTSATETARLIENYFPNRRVTVHAPTSTQEIKQLVAQNIPVIVPLYGKALNNPYFRNGGPIYHMLVVKGYLPDGRFITNDPGIGRGADYIYAADVLWEAMHDWNEGDVLNGKPMILIVRPK